MEPCSSLAAMSDRKKRKNSDPASYEKPKRLKTGQEDDEVLQRGRRSGQARVSVPADHLQQPITLTELTELLHFAALGKTRGIKQPSWCRIRHQKKIQGVNVVIVEGLTQSHFYKNYLTMEHLRTNYTTRVTFTPSSNNIASGIFSSEVLQADGSSVSEPDKTLHKALKQHPVITMFGTQRRGLTAYVLTEEKMIKNRYPVKGMPGFEDFVCTDSFDCVNDTSPLYGLDCEMCLTEKGYELTRVSLVDSDGNCLLDDLVKPPNRILNYLTQFSGVTAAMLQPITTTLRDVQAKLRRLLPGDAVLVGHSLNNDLMALKLIHKHVIDTTLLYRRELGQKFKLKVLAETVLKRQIQSEENRGHNPTEDAVAALNLAQYFIKTGPRQVVELHLEDLWGYTVVDEFHDCAPEPTPSHRFADVLERCGRSVLYLGKRADITLELSNQRWYSADKEMLASFRRQTKCPFLSVLQFSTFSEPLTTDFPQQEQLYRSVCANLRDMCVVFAGPFPAGVTKKEVKRLFSCCGPVRRIKLLNTSVRVHAEVEYELLEGATLALKTLSGFSWLGQPLKVQRPVHESLLDLDLNLDALTADSLNANYVFAVKLSHHMAQRVNISTKVNGHILDGKCSNVTPARAENGFPPAEIKIRELHEETVRETFGHFGAVESVILPDKHEKHAKHACIKFKSSEGKHCALSSSKDLLKDNYLICPSLTPPHLPSWVAMTTAVTAVDADEEAADEQRMTYTHNSSQDQEMDLMMKKLDRWLGKAFRSLPDGTLSVVLLRGHTIANGHHPGLCLLQIKHGS
ncbi:RNA exonuclease 5-like isoform X2 [Cololabis saira]|nr:RNA exonuclease 5-like isoform X2 [Cololabis saira]